jgi:glucosamine-6-phosphate deaminase
MNLRVFRSAGEAGHAAATAVAAQLARKPASVLGLPTGRTSLAVYDALVTLHENGEADFSQAQTFNIDEFVGVASADKRSYCAFMQKHLFSRINLPGSHVHFLNGGTADHEAECERFEREIASLGGMDLLLLGIGGNAHIGFNEPARALRARTHRTRLTLETRRANASLFGGRLDKVPREALTMGVATMLEARSIVLIATGRSKAHAVTSMFSGNVSTEQPASILQLHPNVEVILDLPAAEKLPQSGFDA